MFRALRALAGVQEARLASAKDLSWPLSNWLVPLDCTTKTASSSRCNHHKLFSAAEACNKGPWRRKPLLSAENEAGERVFWQKQCEARKAQRCLSGGPQSSEHTDSNAKAKSDQGGSDVMGGSGKGNESIDMQEPEEEINPNIFDNRTEEKLNHNIIMSQLKHRKEELKGSVR